MTNTVRQQPLISIEHQASRRQMLADIDANLTDMFTHIGATGRTSLAALGDPLVIMDRQRFFAEVASKINSNYDTLNTYQPGLALAHVSPPVSIDSPDSVNVFTSSFDTAAAAVNGATARPTNTVAPGQSGTATVGQTLTGTNGTWTGSPAFTYSWQRNGVAIGGATSITYVLAAGDSGKTVRLAVTGTNAGGAATAFSAGQSIA